MNNKIRTKYVAAITKMLQERKKYTDALDVSIEQVADAMVVRDLCRKDIDQLTSTTVTETTRYGGKLIPHPVFKILNDAQATLIKACKSLGITYEDVVDEIEAKTSPLAELYKMMNEDD